MLHKKVKELDKKLIVKVTAGIILLAVAFAFYTAKNHAAEQNADITIVSEHTQSNEDSNYVKPDLQTSEAAAEIAALIMVDVSGAVKTPGVIQLPEDSRVFQAVEKAGGFTSEAESKVINQAEKLCDGEKLYIPTKKEVMESYPGESDGRKNAKDSTHSYSFDSVYSKGNQVGASKININTADSEALQELSGVGPSTAEKIIDYRKENGNFKSIEELKNVSGIGDKTFEKFKNQIIV